MIRAVFDTNVLVSSMIKRGRPRDLWNAVLDGKIRLVVSEEILEELIGVAGRPKIARYVDKAAIDSFLQVLLQNVELVKTVEGISVVKDPDDNMILEAAVTGGARYVVSGDNHLLKLGSFREIKILTVAGMLAILTG
ncbi:putative toxin-antitoxin system toxin component, PIN family [Nitrososphaera sp.]|uniref:putative toxin-antitoxin system toxin component, PIN family n=1 Tax=Nitrososphaera sp. TaxID=1971748 RepID=UPI00183EAE57|nr:putative toxin-antitoxin system toxin component, PIN family [Nitrososphaera sp.]NWG36569.1 putative toxin-antitoxin system toxin component, PIN family [Nitrososphaera sp.]